MPTPFSLFSLSPTTSFERLDTLSFSIMSNNGSSRWPAVGINNPSLKTSAHASHTLKRLFNEISSVGDTDATSRRRSPSPARQLQGEISVDEPAYRSCCLSQQYFNKEQLITSGPPVSPVVTVKHEKAQLTVFYAGIVNVYDNVPADKAHAIMLLAANNGNAWPVNQNNNFGHLRFSEEATPQLVKRSHTELPFARKVSLARFLEKRKERVQGVQAKDMKGEARRSFQVITPIRTPHHEPTHDLWAPTSQYSSHN